jgi:hypothetical protein
MQVTWFLDERVPMNAVGVVAADDCLAGNDDD